MGPNDPFSSRPSPAPPAEPAAPLTDAASTPGRMRVQARVPDPPRPATRGALAGAVGGLVLGLLVVLFGVGPALVVAVCAGLGAVVGVLAQNLFSDGVDVGAAWRALRRR